MSVSVGHERADPADSRDSPDHLLTIGAFARRSRLSMKALGLYDRIGLLRGRIDRRP
jgi:hypothetical protein